MKSLKDAASKFKAKATALALAFPCLPLACGVLNGSLFSVLNPGCLSPLPSLPGIVAAFLLLGRKGAAVFTLASALGLGSAMLNERLPESHYVKLAERSSWGAVIEAEVVDGSCCGEALSWLPNPDGIELEVKRMKFSPCDSFHEVCGKTVARLPKDAVKPGYGDTLLLDGYFFEPPPPLLEGEFDYRRHLRGKGIVRTFTADSCKFERRGSGAMRLLLDARGGLLSSLCSGMPDDSSKRLAAALMFGCRQGADFATRQDFIRSGTVHILTVSGLHVGMVAVVLLWLLRPLPFRLRHVCVPALTLLYVLSTGMQPPATRAFLMLAAWFSLRAALLSSPALNGVFLAAFALLLWNPAQALDAGFQYSFIAVAFLIGSAGAMKDWGACIGERMKWIPSQAVRQRDILAAKASGMAFKALCGCAIAWLASCGLTLLYQGLYVPQAIPANIILLPLTWLAFVMLGAASALIWLPGAAFLAGAFLDTLLKLMGWICAWFARAGGSPSASPPWWSVALMLCLLAVLLNARGRNTILAASLGILATLTAWAVAPRLESPGLLVMHGGDAQEPSFTICSPKSGFAAVANVPDFNAARDIAWDLRTKGIGPVQSVSALGASREDCAGIKNLMAFVTVRELVMPEFRPGGAAAELEAAAHRNNVEVTIFKRPEGASSGAIKTFSKSGLSAIECASPEFKIDICMKDDGCGLRRIELRDAGGRLIRLLTLKNSLERKAETIELPE